MYAIHLWLVGKHVVDFILVLIEFFCQLAWLRRYLRTLVEVVMFEKGWFVRSLFAGRGPAYSGPQR